MLCCFPSSAIRCALPSPCSLKFAIGTPDTLEITIDEDWLRSSFGLPTDTGIGNEPCYHFYDAHTFKLRKRAVEVHLSTRTVPGIGSNLLSQRYEEERGHRNDGGIGGDLLDNPDGGAPQRCTEWPGKVLDSTDTKPRG